MQSRFVLSFAAGVALTLFGPTPTAAAPRPSITQRPAARGNFTYSNRTYINMIVIHKAEGENAAGWFANPAASGSAHYDVHKNGRIYQSVQDDDIAWHAGNSSINGRSIGIEHGGFSARADTTTIQYQNSARLVAYLCDRYRIPVDRRHIIAHAEVPHPRLPGVFGGVSRHWDPGPHWRWTYFLNLVRSYQGGTSPPPPPAGSGSPTLRQGSRGQAVVELQNLLRARGFDPGPSDGVFGPNTAAKVRAFQASRRLTVDGVVGPNTWRALRQASTPPPASPPPPPASNPTLRHGSRGAVVKRLQDLLRARGFNPGPSDGIFGNGTLAAVRRFQAARRLAVDGVVGPATWRALGQASAAPPPPPAAPAPAAPMTGPVLRHGARGSAVTRLQRALKAKGFDPGPVDGIFGNGTLSAVRRFQSARGLAVDGVVGARTWAALGR